MPYHGRDKCNHLQEENAEIARQLSEEKLQVKIDGGSLEMQAEGLLLISRLKVS